MQIVPKGQKTTLTLTKTECRQLKTAADILRGISYVDRGAAEVSREVDLYSEQSVISVSNSQASHDDLVAADAAETVSEQSPSV